MAPVLLIVPAFCRRTGEAGLAPTGYSHCYPRLPIARPADKKKGCLI